MEMTGGHDNLHHIADSSLNESMSLSAHPYQPSGIRVTLENADLWQSFHSIGTEMIITKHGRRMFPHCSVRVSRLQPFTNYVITMDIVPVDGFKYKWKKEHWEIAGAADPHPPCRTYTHPDSPAPGRHWMKQPLSFPKLKLTNNTLDQHGHIILLSMHRYYPRFHVVQADNPYTLRWGSVQSFSFPETAFTAVTAYQNPKITKLKIDHNPFAKGFREGGTHSHSKRLSNKSPRAKRPTLDRDDLSNSSPSLQRMLSTSQFTQTEESRASTQQSLKGGHLSGSALEPSENIHVEPLVLREYNCSSDEQMVPASVPYQPYRSEYGMLPYPSRDPDGAQIILHPPPNSRSAVEPCIQQHGYFHQYNTTADWSQSPVLSYTTW
ncbi:T-box-containing protein TBX6L-like isoform X1 [Astatotilapia calliptera]|uniref:T-box-containing protein TBX6L-like isoform X1 n=2 Tax=Astatotilapia calliptera TaxID=8154 RepID=UPI000E42BF44|nr:T-box-containing protein TBX6L-like isoform X1 [Astatotilapia calliptera]